MTRNLVVRVRVLAVAFVMLLALPGTAHAAMFFSGENATGVTSSGVGSLHANINSTSSLVYTATFDIGLTTAYGTSVAGSTGANNVPAFFVGTINSVAISGLACGTLYHWRLNVASADVGTDQTLTTSACAGVSPTSKNYGTVNVAGSSAQTFTINNLSGSSISVSSITVIGADAGLFGISLGTCASLTPTIASSGNCTVNVTFSPVATGARTATLRIASNAPDSPVDVALTGSTPSSSIPTVSEWGMIILGLLLVAAMIFSSRRGNLGRPA